jgi:hypothetical protein
MLLGRTKSRSTSAGSVSPLNVTSAELNLTSFRTASYQRASECTALTSSPGLSKLVSGRWYGRTSLNSTWAVFP